MTLLRTLFRPITAEVTVYEVICEHKVSRSVGLIAIQYAPEIRQSIFALIVLDRRYRGMGIGNKALAMAETKLNPGSQYVSAIVSLSDHKALNFWKKCGYLPEAEFPTSINTTFFNQDMRYMRLVKETEDHSHLSDDSMQAFGAKC